ncbi:MAG: biopolymer transporter Tol [Nibricoccus sp.]
MQKLLRFFSVLALALTSGTFAQAASPTVIDIVVPTGELGEPVQVFGNTAELNSLALAAFKAHGYYRPVASGGKYEIRFTAVGGTQVNVQVIKGGSASFNQTFSGTNQRNAFFRAADAAVKATSGLKGFFASKLAFVSNRTGKDEIYVGDLFMGDVRQITRDNAFALTPRWSPDGTKLLYTSYLKQFPDIYMIDLQTNQRTVFAQFRGTNSGARYSPNGLYVAMVLSGEGTPEIYSKPVGGKVSRLTRSEGFKSSPCYSPDSSRIVYAAGDPNPQLYIMSASGGGGQRVGAGMSSYCAEPDWSLGDPSKIAFTFRESSGRFQIAVLDLRTGQSKKVSKAPYDGVEPNWLADGRHLIYTARSAGSRSLFILDTETGRTARIGNISAEKGSVCGP